MEIKIKKKNQGKFTKAAKAAGESVQEHAHSVLNNPNIRVSLYRRDYSSIYSNNYELVNLKDYITNDYQVTNNENEYLLTSNPVDNTEIFMYLKDKLTTGTYKMTFSLYDGNSYIGKVEQTLIIK